MLSNRALSLTGQLADESDAPAGRLVRMLGWGRPRMLPPGVARACGAPYVSLSGRGGWSSLSG